MNKYDELMTQAREELKNLLTADNSEQITKVVATLDELANAHKQTTDENSNLKNKIVDIVKGTTFEKQSEETGSFEPQRALSLDEALKQAEKEILKNRGN